MDIPSSPPPTDVAQAILGNDPLALSKSLSEAELARLKTAEEVLDLARNRKKNTSTWALASQALVGVVAVAGMLVNAYQSYANKQQQQQQAKLDQERWSKEFERAQRADKYRAFFETSVLATDPANPDKRLVGYALLQEFVEDEEYNSKATRLLEESLAQELRTNTLVGLDEQHRNMVLAIVTALSESTDCKALGRAARSFDRIARRHAVQRDEDETSEIFKIYVRRLVGRAAVACKSLKELDGVRRPLVETVLRAPEIAAAARGLTLSEANAAVARTLVDGCQDELGITGVSECPAILQHYLALCGEPGARKGSKDEDAACGIVRSAAPRIAAAASAAPAEPH